MYGGKPGNCFINLARSTTRVPGTIFFLWKKHKILNLVGT
eukprot:COSAG01_NODE_67443_length_267_cov_0.607143_1_plen_39_part_10